MAKAAPGHAHNISGLNLLFAVSAIALFVTTVWMVWDDYSREWKVYQREFFDLERQTTRQQIEQAEANVNQRELQRVVAELQTAAEELEARQGELSELQGQLVVLEDQWTLADVRERELKAIYDSKKFFFEEFEERGHAPLGKRVSAEEFEALETEFFSARESRISTEFERDAIQRSIRDLEARAAALNSEKDGLTQEATLLTRKLDSLAQNLPNKFRNLPMVDFIDPSIEIQQVLVANVTEELNFTSVPRIDRCKTCHMGIDNPAYAEAPQPFRTHPNLDLYVAAEIVAPA